jgi:predicted  nucleic acid-binding Zn-ribbon protein
MSPNELLQMEADIHQLLILQDRDQKWAKLLSELEYVPRERHSLENKVAELMAEIDAAQSQLRDLELARQQIDGDIAAAEEKIRRFKQQQVEVKKNEEYAALSKEMERCQFAIDELENRGLEILTEIDSARATFAEQKAQIEENLIKVRAQIEQLKEREVETKSQEQTAASAFKTAREGVSDDWMDAYDRVRKTTRNFPYVAVICEGKCSGCHLRISGETQLALKQKGAPAFCDQCGRIVYYAEA